MRNVKGNRFSQRHYEAIAEVLSKLQHDSRNDKATLARSTLALAQMFKVDNPKFLFWKFEIASGVIEAPIEKPTRKRAV